MLAGAVTLLLQAPDALPEFSDGFGGARPCQGVGECLQPGLEALGKALTDAERTLGRTCRVDMDLAGPKLRTGALRARGRVQRLAPDRDCFGRLTRPGRVWLTPAEAVEPTPADLRLRLVIGGGLLGKITLGDLLELTNARGQGHRLTVREAHDASWVAEIQDTAYVEEATAVTALRDGAFVGAGVIVQVPEVCRRSCWPWVTC